MTKLKELNNICSSFFLILWNCQ